jgi:hypothetical protein
MSVIREAGLIHKGVFRRSSLAFDMPPRPAVLLRRSKFPQKPDLATICPKYPLTNQVKVV